MFYFLTHTPVPHQIVNQKQIKLIIPVGMMKPDTIYKFEEAPFLN